jgi:hypothetical protein
MSRARTTNFSSRPAALCAALVIALLLGGFAGQAAASVASSIIYKCGHNEPFGGYTPSEYAQALRQLPTEVSEYTACEELIHHAELAAASGGQTGAIAAAATIAPPTPAEQQTLTATAHKSPAPIKLGSQTALPGVVHVDIAAALNSLPAPLVALIVLLLAAGVAIGVGSLPHGIVEQLRSRRRK